MATQMKLVAPADYRSAQQKIETSGMIQVDRTRNPIYPKFRTPIFPELENSGPSEYPLSQIMFGYLETEKGGQEEFTVPAEEVWEAIQEDPEQHLGLLDGYTLIKLGLEYSWLCSGNFGAYGSHSKLYLYKSAVRFLSQEVSFPFLYQKNEKEVGLGWVGILGSRGIVDPALMFKDI